MIAWWRTSFGEEEVCRIADAVSKERLSQGPVTADLESEIATALGVPHVVLTTSGSVALWMAVMALEIGRGDEVLVPNRTWIATAHAPLLVGAKAVLVDVRNDVPVMDLKDARRKITPRTKAIIPVHLNGRAVDMTELRAMAQEHGLAIIEDACQALFSRNAAGFLGTQSEVGCFSLGVTKLITTGQGGFCVTSSKSLYERLRRLRNHGVEDQFTETWNEVSCNFKFNDILAASGLVQMQKVPARLEHLKEVYKRYAAAIETLASFKIVPVKVEHGEIPLYIEIRCSKRKALKAYLQSNGVQIRIVPPNLSLSGYLVHDGNFPNSQLFGDEGLYLPCGPSQELQNVDRVIELLRRFEQLR